MLLVLLVAHAVAPLDEHRLERRVVAVRLRLGFVPAGSDAALDRPAHVVEAEEVGRDLGGGEDVEEGPQLDVAAVAEPVREDGRELDVNSAIIVCLWIVLDAASDSV